MQSVSLMIGNLGFGVLPKDALTCGWEEVGIKLPTLCSVDDRLYSEEKQKSRMKLFKVSP